MNETKPLDVSTIQFSSTVYPSAEDLILWESLSAEEKLRVIAEEEARGAQSGTAPRETLEQRLSRVRSRAL